MKTRQPPRLRYFEASPGQRHIQSKDHYLYSRPEPRYRFGIIGTGTMGQEHMRVIALIGEAEVAAVYDPQDHSVDAALATLDKAEAANIRRHRDLASMIADERLDGFFICTPNHTHLSVLKQVLRAGKPVFLEKPMATTLADGREVAALAAEHSGWVQVGLQYRYKAPYVEAWHEFVERGTVGAVKTLAMSEYRPPFLDKVGQWNKFSRGSGGTLVEKCCHYFDLMGRFAGKAPERVFATGGQAVNFRDFDYAGEAADIDDHSFVVIDYADGVRGQFTLNMFAPTFEETLIVSGDQGRLMATERFDPQRPATVHGTIRVETHEPALSRETQVGYGTIIEGSGHSGATFHEHLAFLKQLDGEPTDAATPVEGLWSMLVAEAAQLSQQRGEPVTVAELIEGFGLDALLN